MMLSHLLKHPPPQEIDITSLAIDSRAVAPGALFAAFAGHSRDGSAFIADAVARGAQAVIAPAQAVVPAPALHIVSDQPRACMAEVAARFYGGRAPKICTAVTGTNGKTSVVDLQRQIWRILGLSAASMGTLGVISDDLRRDLGMTTPDILTFHQTLARLADSGVEALAFEASSHACDQHRIGGVSLTAAGFTNLTRDHLDYHHTMEAYFEAKAGLLRWLSPGGRLVANTDDAYGRTLVQRALTQGIACWSLGQEQADCKIIERHTLLQGQRLRITFQGARFDIVLPLVGAFQGDNALLAALLVIASGAEPRAAFEALSHVKPVPGRLEYVSATQAGASVYVDYAHTPDGLRAALTALRPHTRQRLHVVFGCGGDRDRGKRPQMAQIAGELADTVIITDDNPRTEDAAAIRQEVAHGFPSAEIIGDRRTAIGMALHQARSGDLVLVAGKGHEEGQMIGTTLFPFNDAQVVRDLVREEGL